jgi:plasmid stabilization system protein ParE
MSKPKSILDPSFRYTPSVQTDLRKTFARIRKEQRAKEAEQVAAEVEQAAKVLILKPGARSN